jgi:YesN/AraC family two-component response regulator
MEKKTVLLVEDDPVVRDIIKVALEREYIVLEASGYAEAVKLSGCHIDIVLIDYMLHDGNGIGVMKAIRDVHPGLPIIMITAYSSEDVAIKALRAGATDYIKKPLVLACLRKRVADLLEGKNGEQPTENSGTKEDFILDGIEALIEKHYSEDLTRDQLAEKVCMNKYKFSKLFNKRIGQNIKSYINNVRVKKAAELLKNHDLSSREIAFSVGFQSVEHFFRVFKEIYGVSPKEYNAAPVKKSEQSRYLWESE